MNTLHQIDNRQIIQKSAEFLINNLRLYHNITQKTLLLLSGGSATDLYKPLADFIRKSDLDWKFLTIAQVDERFQPVGEDINAYRIEKTGLWEVCKKKKIPYFVVSQNRSLKDSAKQYNLVLEKLFKESVYKIAVLGIGVDGHTAGLLPGYERNWNTANIAAGYENSGRFKQRISITPKAIKMLDQIIVMANGEKKRAVVNRITDKRQQETLNELPAIILREIPQVDLFTDLIS